MRIFDWKPLYQGILKKKDISKLSKQLKISRIASEVLIRRGLGNPATASKYVLGSYKEMYDPYLFQDMIPAVHRIKIALKNKETILVHGDYDCDGITATALIMIALENIGIPAQSFIPNRSMGYGLSKEGLQKAIDIGAKVLITCDCGSNEHAYHAKAKRAGIDVIVLDHHSFQKRPKVYAFLNPEDQSGLFHYPFTELCGAGVAFKFMQALGKEYPTIYPENYIELAALATIADSVPLIDENRIIVKEGLKRMNSTSNLGLHHLLKVSSVLHRKITSEIVGFILAPKINAPGRIANPGLSLELLLTIDDKKADEIAHELSRINKERMGINNQIRDEAIEMVEKNFKNDRFLVLQKDSWNKGVIGIVASTMTEIYHKPCAIIANGYGSVRTVPEYSLLEPLEGCKDLLDRWGGHPMAAGLKIKKKNIKAFRERINSIAKKVLSPDPKPYMLFDAKLKLKDLSLELVKDLEKLEPFGNGNPLPHFTVEDVHVARTRITKDGQHLQLSIRQRNSLMSAIGFWMTHYAELLKDPAQKFDILFTLERGKMDNAQIQVRDLKEVELNW